MRTTDPHFIRCIKPNPHNLPDIYDRPSVTEQLRYGGVLQAVQVSPAQVARACRLLVLRITSN